MDETQSKLTCSVDTSSDPIDRPRDFGAVYKSVAAFSCLDWVRALRLYELASERLTLRGDMAEVGVYRGGSARVIHEAMRGSGKTLHLFDTFEGMPDIFQPGKDDYSIRRTYNNVTAPYREALRNTCTDARIYKGVFPQTAAHLTERSFCFVHFDADLYRSAIAALSFFYPRLVIGGVIVLDDFARPQCPGVYWACGEYLSHLANHCYAFSVQWQSLTATLVKLDRSDGAPTVFPEDREFRLLDPADAPPIWDQR